MKTADLMEQRAALVDRMNAAHTADDDAAFKAAETELRGIDAKLDRAKALDAAERNEPGTPIHGDAKLSAELHKRFSLIRAMAMQAGIGGHDYGFEREVQPELAKRAGKPAEGVHVPTEIFLERRTALSTSNPSGEAGNLLIATELHGEMFFDRLRNALKVQGLGATILSGLTGNVDIPGLKDSATVGWVAEDSALTGSTPGFRKISLTPKHAGGITEISRNMLQQASRDVEALVRNDFALLLAGLIDGAAISGTGSSNQPTGILATSGIGSLAMGTNGAAWTGDAARDLMSKCDVANAPATSRGFLTNAKVKNAALKAKDGQSRYLGLGVVFAGERVEFSNAIASNGTKGSGSNLSTVIYGNWSDLLIGYWSAFDLLVNPYESTAYTKSAAFAKLAPRTKADYLAHLGKIEGAKLTEKGPVFATYPLEVIEDPKIRKRLLDWRDEMARTSPRQADATFGVLRIILEWARDRGMIAYNHATRPKKVYTADRSDKIWLPEHLASFRAVASPEMAAALAVALWTGQRQGDVLKLAWTSYKDGKLTFRQGKRKRKVDMPVYSELRTVLDALPRRAATILTTPSGKPWGKVHFQHHWRKATLEAGLDGLHFHDIRGTTCTTLADAKCTPSEIASMLGWTVKTVNEMLDRYQAMTAAQSESAVAKLEARR